jgi:transmembrane sensor
VQQWLNADASNKAYFEQLKKVWDASRQLASQSSADENAAWKRFQQRIHPETAPVIVAKRKNTYWLRIAAAAVLIIGIAMIGYVVIKGQQPEELTLLARETVVKDTLPDGTMVTLNKQSLVSYPSSFKGNRRMVNMKGEVFFNVNPDKTKPFIIQTNGIEITVVGTSFNVKSENGSTEVIVETGIVKVTKDEKTVELKAGEKTMIAGGVVEPVKEKVTDKLYNHYRTRQFVCDNTPLWRLAEVLSEAYDTTIVIANKDIRNLPINSTYYELPLGRILNLVKDTHANTHTITIEYEGDKIILK